MMAMEAMPTPAAVKPLACAILLSSTGSGDPMLLSLDRPVTPAQRQAIRWQTRDAHLEHAAGTSKTRLTIPIIAFWVLWGMSPSGGTAPRRPFSIFGISV